MFLCPLTVRVFILIGSKWNEFLQSILRLILNVTTLGTGFTDVSWIQSVTYDEGHNLIVRCKIFHFEKLHLQFDKAGSKISFYEMKKGLSVADQSKIAKHQLSCLGDVSQWNLVARQCPHGESLNNIQYFVITDTRLHPIDFHERFETKYFPYILGVNVCQLIVCREAASKSYLTSSPREGHAPYW